VRFRLLPTDDRFFTLFDQAAENAAECARRLRDVIAGSANGGHERINECEHRGDEITRTILQRLNSTFVTPFDREDIHALAEAFDDVVDDIQMVSQLMLLTHVTDPIPEMAEQAELLVRMAEEAEQLINRLEQMKGVQPHLDAIDTQESEGDAIYRRILSKLYSGELASIEVLRTKDLVGALEGAMNRIEDISDVVESIVLKHA
jgi:predicted phosphate transport protein (TIGR00153 family)